MSLTEITLVISIALLLVAGLLSGAYLLLAGTNGVDFSLSQYFGRSSGHECAEEDFTGVCGIRKFMQGDSASKEVEGFY